MGGVADECEALRPMWIHRSERLYLEAGRRLGVQGPMPEEGLMRVGSLFSGGGLMDAGLARAGFEHAWLCESDPFARRLLDLRWPGVPVYEDARAVGPDLAPVDLLAAGFPCTDLSVVGQRAGLSGASSGLWSEVTRVVRQLRPRYLFVENVPALLTRGMETVLGDLAASGYDAEWDCLPAAALGAPHVRARVWLVAYPAGFGDGLPEGRLFAGREGFEHDPRWASEPGVRRVDDGSPDRVDRLRVLGNGVVAPIAELIGRRILEAEASMTSVLASAGKEGQ